MVEQTEKSDVLYIAKTPDTVYWSAGWHEDSPLHAIASAREFGYGSSGDVYVCWKGVKGCYINDFGFLSWPNDAEEPELWGVYDAAGNLLGESLKEVAKYFAEGKFYDTHCLDDETIESLKRHARKEMVDG